MEDRLEQAIYDFQREVFDIWTDIIYEQIAERRPEALSQLNTECEGLRQSFYYTFQNMDIHHPNVYNLLDADAVEAAENIIAEYDSKGDE